MAFASPNLRVHRRNLVLIALAFAISRGLAFWSGMRYLGNEDGWLIQLLDLDILHHHLLRGLLHLHAQPPLFNLLVGLSLKIAGPHSGWLLLTVQMSLDLAASLSIYLTLVILNVSPTFSLAVTLLSVLNPSAILYDFDALYTSFVYSLHCFIALAAARFVTARSRRALGYLIALGVFLTLLRSTYHWLWLLGILGILIWQMPSERRRILRYGTAGLLLAVVWPAKNYVLFGHFSSTTWAPYNLSRMWGGTALVRARSPLLRSLEPADLSKENTWLEHNWKVPAVGSPELDDIARVDGATNWNSLSMLRLHDAQVRDDLYLLRHDPGGYIHHVYLAALVYFAPAYKYLTESDLEFWEPSHQLYRDIEPLERPLGRICCYTLGYRTAADTVQSAGGLLWVHIREVCLGAVLAFCLVVTCLLSILFFPQLWSAGAIVTLDDSRHRKAVALLLGFTILYAFGLSSLFEIGENMRFRYETHALVLIVVAVFLQQFASYRRELKQNRAGPGSSPGPV